MQNTKMNLIIEGLESRVDEAAVKSTAYFYLSVEDGKLRMVDLNDNVTLLDRDDINELVKALNSFKSKVE